MRQKFCFFDYNINFGGAPKGTVALCASLKSDLREVIIYDVYGKNVKYLDSIRQSQIPLRIIYSEGKNQFIGGNGFLRRMTRALMQFPDFLRIVSRTRGLLKADGISLVWVNNNKSLVTVSFASLGLGIKKILYHRGWATPKSIDLLFRFFIRWQCDVLIGHSRATESNLKMLFPKKRVYFSPNSVSVSNVVAVRRDNRVSPSHFQVLLPAARPVMEKGHHIAVLALRKLMDRGYTGITLLFTGEIGVGVGDQFVEGLKAMIVSLQLSDKVKFIGWLDSLDETICNADAVILPSYTEGLPRVILEAMLLKTPIIATPVGGIPEAVFHQKTGLIVDVGDVDMLADSIASLIDHPNLSSEMTARAYSFARENFSSDGQIECIGRAFDGAFDKV